MNPKNAKAVIVYHLAGYRSVRGHHLGTATGPALMRPWFQMRDANRQFWDMLTWGGVGPHILLRHWIGDVTTVLCIGTFC